MPARSRFRSIAALPVVLGMLFLGALHAAPATAQQETAQQEVAGERIGDWMLVCPPAQGGSGCFLTQRHVAEDTGLDLLGAAIFFHPETGQPMIQIRVPPQVARDEPVGLKVDAAERLVIGIDRCTEGYCSTTGTLPPDLLQRFKAGNQAVVDFMIAELGQRLVVPMSLAGFTRAFAMLEQRNGG